MKIQFDAGLSYQQAAISAVVDVFRGAQRKSSPFTVARGLEGSLFAGGADGVGRGYGNALSLLPEELLANIQAVQRKNALPISEKLGSTLNLDVEMETGTGKTYVYLRTILELNKAYGFTKFIIVVPSTAIREGVQKTIDITREHFRALYQNVIYDYFVYDGARVERLRDFAVSTDIEIMVINIDSFQKTVNIINRESEKFSGSRPIELVKATRPIVIIDEPQSSISSDSRVSAIEELEPLCTIRYSATPIRVENRIYKLDAVDSYEQKLVKSIEVTSFAVKNDHNEAYMLLKSVNNRSGGITAKLELDVQGRNGEVKRKVVKVRRGDDLEELSGRRAIYRNMRINDIFYENDVWQLELSSMARPLVQGKAIGTAAADELKKQQIRATIIEHLDKELVLNPLGIKVLSLFFIDRVANYRIYDEEGNAQLGKYARWFEKIYTEVMREEKYHSLFAGIHNEHDEADLVHDGYFSQDKARKNAPARWKDTNGTTKADDSTYNLIMRDKERLLSFDCKVRFIFSHSALKEGWDNPNVFQICTLNETQSTIKKRQEIGRGLRLCVNQNGARQYDPQLNRLTVMANESYEEFASSLQQQYEEDGIVFGVLRLHTVAAIRTNSDDENPSYLGELAGQKLLNFFVGQSYIDENGRVQEKLRTALDAGTVELPAELASYRAAIEAACRKAMAKVKIYNTRDRQKAEVNKEVFLNEEFRALWDRIKWKTRYYVKLDTAKLLTKARAEIADPTKVKVVAARVVKNKANISIDTGGVKAEQTLFNHKVSAYGSSYQIPDIVTYLQNETRLTRRTIVELLTGKRQNSDGEWENFDDYGDRLADFKKNPQSFMEQVAAVVCRIMREFLVEGIRYERLGDTEFYAQELLESNDLSGYLKSNMRESKKSIYNYVVYDSENERKFADHFEADTDVVLYAKLPDWFKINTPLGSYNPDWAVLYRLDNSEKLYFIMETKGSVNEESLRPTEAQKIHCGRAHFGALATDVHFRLAADYSDFKETM